ncbi:hypothetical protein PVAP13_6NG105709 [Panicum virgatum]|uniref:Uncharacterized protein n=1 Tax=Panicum virgatum TaxID=38727 RepID=A0A8T0QWD2_PANVG|nr:hypothetical protein PVAP13_6NG105709 [Panicum virgatum]
MLIALHFLSRGAALHWEEAQAGATPTAPPSGDAPLRPLSSSSPRLLPYSGQAGFAAAACVGFAAEERWRDEQDALFGGSNLVRYLSVSFPVAGLPLQTIFTVKAYSRTFCRSPVRPASASHGLRQQSATL